MFNQALSERDLNELLPLARYEEYAPGALIFAEGATNDRLFFLVEGSVTIIHTGETIAQLNKPGDILGEMSLITRKTSSAASFAEVPTKFLILEIEKVGTLSPDLQNRMAMAMNRLFALTLATKLETTNEKARLFEITNRELKDAKAALEAASIDKIDELSFQQRQVFKKLDRLFRNDVTPLRDTLAKLTHEPTIDATAIAKLSTQVQRIHNDLEPLSQAIDSEGSLHDQRVLLVEDDVNEQINARMSLGGTGVDFTVLADLESAKEALRAGRFDIVCVNNRFVELIAYARSLYSDVKYVFVTSEPIAAHLSTLEKHPELATILARHPDDRTFTVKNTATTIRKLSSQDIFGMEKYLSWGTEVIEYPVTSSDERRPLIEKMEAYIDSLGIRNVLKRKASRVAEELLMNAIYDAPTDVDGKSLYNHHDRSVPLVLKPEEHAMFRFACDGTFLAISVVDSFGALSRATILDYLKRCFSDQTGESIADKGGGGNGLFQIIQSSSLTAFNVKPGQRTEVIALLNINIQMEKVSLHPSFHYFEN